MISVENLLVVQGTTDQLNSWKEYNKQHTDNPTILSYTKATYNKSCLAWVTVEFDYKIFDKIGVETVIKTKVWITKVIELQATNNHTYIHFLQKAKMSWRHLLTNASELYKMEPLKNYLNSSSDWFLPANEADIK